MLDILLAGVVAFSLALLLAAWIYGMIVIGAILFGIFGR